MSNYDNRVRLIRKGKAISKTYRGRPIEVLQRKIVVSVTQGLPLSQAAAMHSVHPSTVIAWIEKGERYYHDMQRGEERDEYEGCYRFSMEIRRARAYLQKMLLGRSLICEEFKPSWVRDMTLLSRIDPKNWSSKREDNAEAAISQVQPDERFL